jgi:hypothetical protein
MTTGIKVNLGPGWRIDKKTGKPVRNAARLDVSRRLKQAASKKIRINRGTK